MRSLFKRQKEDYKVTTSEVEDTCFKGFYSKSAACWQETPVDNEVVQTQVQKWDVLWETSGEGHRNCGSWLIGVQWRDSFSWEILRALSHRSQLLAVLKAGLSDFTAFQLFTKVSRNGAGLSASRGMHFSEWCPSSLLALLFLSRDSHSVSLFVLFTLYWEELNTVLLFFPLKERKTYCVACWKPITVCLPRQACWYSLPLANSVSESRGKL